MRPSSFAWSGHDWRRLVAATCLSAAVFVTAILLTRLPGASMRVSAWWTLATAILIGGLGAASISSLSLRTSRRLKPDTRLALATVTGGLTALSTFATASQAGIWQLALASMLTLSISGVALVWAVAPRFAWIDTAPDEAAPRSVGESPTVAFEQPDESIRGASSDDEDAQSPALPEHVDQTLSRYTMEGRDHLEACVRVRFETGQQTAIVHLPIQPAMQFDPEVECETVDGDDVRVTVDPAQPYGVRLVCRRPAGSDPGEAIVAVLISADRMARAAA